MRYGIKSEIHSCFISLCKYFSYLKDYYDFLEELKRLREDVQYYLKEPEEIKINKVKEFHKYCELEIDEINSDKIKIFREKLKNI